VPAEAAQMVGAATGKVIFEKPGRVGSNLDELGQIVSSSGLVGSGLVTQHRREAEASSNKVLKPAAIGGAIALLLAAGVLIGLNMRGSSSEPVVQNNPQPPVEKSVEPKTNSPGAQTASNKTKKPGTANKTSKEKTASAKNLPGGSSMAAIDLSASKVVIFLFDRGEATRPFVNDLRRAALNSAKQLGNEQKFQIVYWTASGETPLAPETPEAPSESVIEQTGDELAKIEITRSTDIEPALEIALEGEPTDIVIASAKGWQLDEDFVKFVMDSVESKSIRIHTIAFTTGPESESLKKIASETGGQFVVWK